MLASKESVPGPPKGKPLFCRRGKHFAHAGMGWRVTLRSKIFAHCFARAYVGGRLRRCEYDCSNAVVERGFSTCTAFLRCICVFRARRLRRAAYVGMGADLPHVALLVLRCSVEFVAVGDGVLDVPLARRARNSTTQMGGRRRTPRQGRVSPTKHRQK